MLFLSNKSEDNNHFVYIKNINKFLYNINKYKYHKKIYYNICKNYKIVSSKLYKHLKIQIKFDLEDIFYYKKYIETILFIEELSKHNYICLIMGKNY